MKESTKKSLIEAHEKTRGLMGTITGAALGFLVAGPIGAVVGGAAGYIGHDARSLKDDHTEPMEE